MLLFHECSQIEIIQCTGRTSNNYWQKEARIRFCSRHCIFTHCCFWWRTKEIRKYKSGKEAKRNVLSNSNTHRRLWKINGERYHTYCGAFPISRSRAAGSVYRCGSGEIDDRKIYSPIDRGNVARTHGIPRQPGNTAVDKNISSDGPRSGSVDCSMQCKHYSITKADHAHNDNLSVIKFRVEEKLTSLELMQELLQPVSSKRQSL